MNHFFIQEICYSSVKIYDMHEIQHQQQVKQPTRNYF